MARYKSVHTGPQIDSGVERALPGGEIDQMRPTRNLLDNWDFRNPVNQRGLSSYGAAWGYTIDRWKNGTGEVAVENGGLTISESLMEYIEYPSKLFGKTLTASVVIDGAIYSGTCLIDGTVGAVNTFISIGSNMQAYMYVESSTSVAFRVFNLGNPSRVFGSVKLELGSVSTLANDPPADYGAELAKCKRYCNLWASEAARTAALLELGAMRTTPVLSTLDIGGVTYYAAIADL